MITQSFNELLSAVDIGNESAIKTGDSLYVGEITETQKPTYPRKDQCD